MTQEVDLPITDKGDALLFPAKFLFLGHTHHFLVNVYVDVVFEPDEERNYKALLTESKLTKRRTNELLQAIAKPWQRTRNKTAGG